MNGEFESLDIEIKELGIKIPEPEEIHTYLRHFPNTKDLLLPLCRLASEQFKDDDNSTLYLEAFYDPENDESPEEIPDSLMLLVRQRKYDGNIMEIIEEIERKYDQEYKEKIMTSTGWIHLHTDFQPPK